LIILKLQFLNQLF